MVILGDLDQDRARAQAEKYDIPQWGSSDDVLTHPDVEIIVNLTIPAAHAPVASEAIAAGKHVWSEKPISVDRASGRALLEQAESAGLLVGVAPDTMLGQGCRPRAARSPTATSAYPCPRRPSCSTPDRTSSTPTRSSSLRGAGPLFDMGPYYITTLVHISDRSPQLRQWGQRIAPPAPSRSEIGWEPSSRLTSPPTCRPSRSSPVEGEPERVQLPVAAGKDGRRRDHRHGGNPHFA